MSEFIDRDLSGSRFERVPSLELASTVSYTEPGWPRIEQFPFAECLLIVVTEEWEHRLHAERDLAALSRR